MSIALTSRQWVIVGLTVATAIIHLLLAFLGDSVDFLFVLNGLGYLALIVALYFLPQLAGQRSLIRWALMGYTAVTFILYFVMTPDILSPLGLITKAIELILIILLWLDRNA